MPYQITAILNKFCSSTVRTISQNLDWHFSPLLSVEIIRKIIYNFQSNIYINIIVELFIYIVPNILHIMWWHIGNEHSEIHWNVTLVMQKCQRVPRIMLLTLYGARFMNFSEWNMAWFTVVKEWLIHCGHRISPDIRNIFGMSLHPIRS